MANMKDASPGSANASVLRRSGRDTSSRKQTTSNPVSSRKSERIEKHTSPGSSPVKNKLEKTEKLMGPSPLRRSDRGKNLVEIPELPNIKSTKEKTTNNSKQCAEDANKVKGTEKQNPDVGGRKRKRFTAIHYKATFKPQRIRIQSDDDEDPDAEVKDKSPQAKSSRNEDVDKELKTQNSISVQGAPDKDCKAVVEGSAIDLDKIEHDDCPQTKSPDGKSIESGDVKTKTVGNVSPSNGNIASGDNHMVHTSSCRVEHDSENQQEPDTCHKVAETHKAASIMDNAENNDVSSNMQTSKFVEFWVPIQISNAQLEQYCATLLSNAMHLCSSSKNDTFEALYKIYISNRKCCNHPYIVDATLQESLMKVKGQSTILDVDVKASGKLQFLDYILPEIRKQQLKVLILSQPTSGTLNGCLSLGQILLSYFHQRYGENSYEHVDGVGKISSKKQAAINMFNKETDRFILLLESRSCHQSIKLSSVDVIIIFDSDLNPSNDLKSLQKMSIDSQSEQIMVFRLFSSSTLEEKILKLAENNIAIDTRSHVLLPRSYYDVLFTWGPSDLFDKLTKFHSQTVLNISPEESFLKDVVEEFLYIISHKCKSSNTTSKSLIVQVQSCGNFSKSIPLHSEIKTHLHDGDQPYVFWKKLLEGRSPTWKFVSESTPRQRKRPSYFLDSPPRGKSGVDGGGVKTRRRTVFINSTIESAQLKTVTVEETGGVNEGVPAANDESQSSSGDRFWSTAVDDETSLLDQLKPTVSELCNILKFSEDVKIIVETFLEFVLENYQVGKEHTSTLHAFMISLCWIGSSLGKSKIDRSESFALAKKHFDFRCMEEEVDSVYKKLKAVKETFLQQTHILDRLKDSIPAPEEVKPEIEKSQHIHNVVAIENHGSCENVSEKGKEEFEKIKREWDEKRANLENEYNLDKSMIHALYGKNPAIRAEKLIIKDREFTNKLEEHERLWEMRLEELKATMLAAEGQVTAENEFSLHGSQSGNPEVASTLPEIPIKVRSHDEPVCEGDNDIESTGSHTSEKEMVGVTVSSERIGEVPAQQLDDDMDVNVAEKVDSSHENAKGGAGSPDASHAVEDSVIDQTETGVNDVAPGVNSGDMDVPAGDYNKESDEDCTVGLDTLHVVVDRHENVDDVAPEVECVEMGMRAGTHVVEDPVEDHNEADVNDMAPHVDSGDKEMPAGNYNKENNEDDHRENVNDLTLEVEFAEMGMPGGTCERENTEDGEITPDVGDNHNETSPYDKQPRVDSDDMEMSAGNYDKENNGDDTMGLDTSHVVKDRRENVDDVAPEVEYAEMGMPGGTCERENIEDGEITSDGDNHNETSPYDVLPRADSGDMEMPAGSYNKENNEDDTMGLDTSHIVEVRRENVDDVAPEVECAEMGMPGGTCERENIEDGEITSDVGDNHNETIPNDVLPRAESAEMATPAGTCDKEHIEDGEIILDTPNVGDDHNETSPKDVLPHVESAEMALPAGNEENAEDIIRPDALHAAEDHNGYSDSDSSNPVCAAISQAKTPNVQPVSSPASDHSESLQLEQLPDGGVQDVGINDCDLQPSGANQLDQIILDVEPDFPSSAVAETLHEEHQPPLASSTAHSPPVNALHMFDNIPNRVSSQMPHQSNPLQAEVERLHIVKDNVTKFHQESKQRLNSDCEKEIAESIAQIRLKYEAKHLEADAAYNKKKMELETNIYKVNMNKILAEAFRSKCQDLTSSGHTGMQQVSEAGLMQQLRRLSSPGQSSGNQQPLQPPPPSPSLPQLPLLQPQPQTRPRQPVQVVHQSAALFSGRPSPVVNQVTAPTAPTASRPLPTRPPPIITHITPSTAATTSRPRLASSPITPSTLSNSSPPSIAQIDMSAANLRISTETCGQASHMRPLVSSEPRASAPHNRPLVSSEPRAPTPYSRPLVSNEPRAPAPQMRPTASIEPRAPAPHMRPTVGSEPRVPSPLMRPLVGSEIRAPAPHLRSITGPRSRPFRSMPSVSPDLGTYHGMLPGQHVTIDPSQSTIIPLPSASSPQLMTRLPSEPVIVPPPPPQPPSEPSTVQPSPPPEQTPSLAHANNAPRWVDVLTPQPDVRSQADLTREGTAQSPDLVCLSDDD